MKKTFIFFLMVLMSLGCSLDKHPLNGPSTVGFPSSEEEATAGTYAAYRAVATNYGHLTAGWWRTIDCISDIGTGRVASAAVLQLTTSTISTENKWIVSFYKYSYIAIGHANYVLDGLDNLSGKVPESTIASLKAELLCIRAFCYDQLVQYYGAVPYIDHALSLRDKSYPRMAKEEIVSRLLEDLDDALIDALPLVWPSSEGTARFSRAAAYMLKARICLNHATLSNGYYEKAAEYADKAIAIAHSNGSKLAEYDLKYYPTHADGEPNCALFAYAGENDPEWLWSLQYNDLTTDLLTINVYYIAPRTLNGASWMGPSQAFIDAIQCTDGKHITESPLYDWQDPWKNRDPRLDLFCVRDNSRTMGVEYSLDVTREKVHDYMAGTDIANSNVIGNKSEYGPNGTKGPGGYLWRKGYDNAFYGAITGGSREQTKDAINNGVFRLSELYLIAAEARIEAGVELDVAKEYIDRIRRRVNMPDVVATDQAGLRSALRYERMVELCNEGFRWYDLRRWGIAEKAMNHEIMAPGQSSAKAPRNFISNAKPSIDSDCIVSYSADTWDGKPSNLRKFSTYVFTAGKDEFWPIPKSELDSNEAMEPSDQNPGY